MEKDSSTIFLKRLRSSDCTCYYLLQCTQLKRKMSILNCFRLFCVCAACVYVYGPHVCVVSTEVRRGCWMPWSWSYRQLQTMWMLGTRARNRWPTLSWQWILFKVLLLLPLPYSVRLNPLTTVQPRASPVRNEQTDHWSSPSGQGSDSPTDLLLSVLGKTATPRSNTMKQFPSQPSFPGRCWRTPKQKACVFPQVLAHKGGPGREQRMLGTATKGPVNKVTKKCVWY